MLAQCDVLTPEIALTWAVVEPAPGQLDLASMDELVAFARQHAKRVHGHNLLWGLSLPGWVESALRETRDWSIIARFFGSVIPRYGDTVHEWNVVNEVIDTGHREYDLPEQRDRRYLLLELLERLRAENVPLDGFGMQSRLELAKGSISAKALDAFFTDVSGLGLSITITELDVKEAAYMASPAERDRAVGDEVRRYLDVMHPAVLGVVTWGLSDRHSWLGVTKEDYARFPCAWTHGDGPGVNRGLPLDAAMQPAPMFYAIAEALRAHGRSTGIASR